jgi:hypothetical protein
VVFSDDAPEDAPSAAWVQEVVIVADACRISPEELMARDFVAEAWGGEELASPF